MRRRRQSGGFTLMEVMIAMALAGIVTASVLALVRTQLQTFEMNDQILRTQQSARAAMDFLETNVRRACGGISSGSVAVNVGSVHQQASCLHWVDGATISGSSFSVGTATTTPDALEVVYATGTMTALTAKPTLAATTSAAVADVSQFSTGDFVLLTDQSYANAYMFKIQSISPTPNPSARPQAGTLTFVTVSGTLANPTTPFAPDVGWPVFKAATYSFFVAPAGTQTYGEMLMVDTDGVAGTGHNVYNSSTVQPLVEGVVDFQVAIGNDSLTTDGIITENTSSKGSDEWIGNGTAETIADPPWFGTGQPQPKQVRLSLMLKTLTSYSGAAPALPTFEDRTTYPSLTSNYNYRYRWAQTIVAPRAWNLSE